MSDLPRSERLLAALERDGFECVWCRRPLPAGHPDLSLEHVVPRLKGGPAWACNEVAACRSCNRARGHVAPAAWLEACETRGLRPNRAAIEASLLALSDAIALRGGQRRARPYLDGQLRRLGLTVATPRDEPPPTPRSGRTSRATATRTPVRWTRATRRSRP